jgi:hypothetical protein
MPDNRITIHVDMDYFFAQCEEREHPELKGKPVVICVYSGRGGDSSAKKLNSVKKLQISGYPIIEYEHIPVSRLKCEHSHRNKQ